MLRACTRVELTLEFCEMMTFQQLLKPSVAQVLYADLRPRQRRGQRRLLHCRRRLPLPLTPTPPLPMNASQLSS
jgi:hypothetical protein